MVEKKAFVTGHPIAHSRSPKIHGYWLNTYGIDGSYRAIDVAPADRTENDRGDAGGRAEDEAREAKEERDDGFCVRLLLPGSLRVSVRRHLPTA